MITLIYKYPVTNYLMNILVPIFVMVGLIIWAITGTVNEGLTPLYKLIFTVVPILLFFGVLGLSNPSKVEVTDEKIIFSAIGMSHVFNWNEVRSLKLKNYHYIGKMYVRVGNPTFLRGRYWISSNMNGYVELINILYEKSLKLRVQKGG